jgi:hypothetical protein
MTIFKKVCDEHDIMSKPEDVFSYLRQFPEEKDKQISLFSSL